MMQSLSNNNNNSGNMDNKDIENTNNNNNNNNLFDDLEEGKMTTVSLDDIDLQKSNINKNNDNNDNDNDDDFQKQHNNTNNNLWTLRVLSFKTVEIHIASTSTIHQVKQAVRRALLGGGGSAGAGAGAASSTTLSLTDSADNNPNDNNNNIYNHENDQRKLRLICKGRLLAPDDAVLTEFRVQDGDVLHAVLSAAAANTNTNTNTNTSLSSSSSTIEASPSTMGSRRRRRHRSTTTGTGTSSRSSSRRQQQQQQHLIVGPGGRVTRSSNYNYSDDDSESSSSSYDDDDDGINVVTFDEETGQPIQNSIPSQQQHQHRQRQRRQRLGFDRLLRPRSSRRDNNNNNNNNNNVGLSRQDIAVLRTYFSRQIDRFAQTTPNPHLDEPDLQRRRLLIEEDWMAQQGPTSEFRLNLNQSLLFSNATTGLFRFAATANNNNNNNAFGDFDAATRGTNGTNNATTTTTTFRGGSLGTDRDFAWGFLLGFFVGFVMLVWVWMPTVPHKQKIGILTGISFQLAMNVLQNQEEEPDEFEE